MPRTLAAAVNSGWAVVGAAAEADAVPLSELQIDRPTVLVMGELWLRDRRACFLVFVFGDAGCCAALC
jgi:hypothetical protein